MGILIEANDDKSGTKLELLNSTDLYGHFTHLLIAMAFKLLSPLQMAKELEKHATNRDFCV